VWVEADGPCEVEVLRATSPTFEVEGHHFALVHVTGLPAEGNVPYEVAFDGERALRTGRPALAALPWRVLASVHAAQRPTNERL